MSPVLVTASKSSLHLVEMFSSVQGEGICIGSRQIFIRFPGCNLKCNYCDTVHDVTDTCSIESEPSTGIFDQIQNPVSLQTVLNKVVSWKNQWPNLHHSISITGGEPLLFASDLTRWLPALRQVLPIYLETNGTLPLELSQVIENVDFVSMDFKLPSTSRHSDFWSTHVEFLQIAASKHCFVKAVVGIESTIAEIQTVAQMIASVRQDIPLILQPVSKQLEHTNLGTHLLVLQAAASEYLDDVRIIPQTHIILKVL